ncbi:MULTISPECIES: clostripain-related cysteine peptidase [unclassified Legionella]|uniref:clostripain-related cysteine peptidase n=1 Tax=unclassified Legionella TaxID=2622702 RepID=UPI001056AD03|nr:MULTISPECIES: clostripain-related cysteine peptidase [unclassified Legionella]MDI9818444.1 clostripain-related cysteine peptidase [Legionella sp. PL877]
MRKYWVNLLSSFCFAANASTVRLPLEFISVPLVSNMAVGQVQTLNYSIRNNVQTQNLPIRAITVVNDGDNQPNAVLSINTTCGAFLAPNASCGITLTIKPTGGVFRRHLSIDYNGRTSLISSIEFTAAPAKYTVLVYMVGSDLESQGNYATANIRQMMTVGSSANMNIILETGGANKPGWRTVQRKIVFPGSVSLIQDLGSVSMGATQTIQNFMEWGINTYPAEKYILIFWDHGGGPNGGFGGDEVTPPPATSISQLAVATKGAFSRTGKKFEIIGFDACLLGNVETFAGLYPYTSYLIGSEDLEPGNGWQYNTFLHYIENHPAATGLSIGVQIINGFTAQNQEDSTTLSLIDSSKMPALLSAISTFANALHPYANLDVASWKNIARSRFRAPDYNTSVWDNSSTDVVDLWEFAASITQRFPHDPLVVQATNRVKEAVQTAVKYFKNSPNRDASHGLTVYFPSILAQYVTDYPAHLRIKGVAFFPQSYIDLVSEYHAFYTANTAGLRAVPNNLNFDGTSYTVDITNDYDELYAVVGSDSCTNVFDDGNNNLPALPCYTGLQNPDSSGEAGTVSFNRNDNLNNWPMLNGEPVLLISDDETPDTPEDDTFLIPVMMVNGGRNGYLYVLRNPGNGYQVIGFQDKTGSANSEGKLFEIDDGEQFYIRTYAFNGGWTLLRTSTIVTAPFTLGFGPVPVSFNAFRFLVGDLTGALTITDISAAY